MSYNQLEASINEHNKGVSGDALLYHGLASYMLGPKYKGALNSLRQTDYFPLRHPTTKLNELNASSRDMFTGFLLAVKGGALTQGCISEVCRKVVAYGDTTNPNSSDNRNKLSLFNYAQLMSCAPKGSLSKLGRYRTVMGWLLWRSGLLYLLTIFQILTVWKGYQLQLEMCSLLIQGKKAPRWLLRVIEERQAVGYLYLHLLDPRHPNYLRALENRVEAGQAAPLGERRGQLHWPDNHFDLWKFDQSRAPAWDLMVSMYLKSLEK